MCERERERGGGGGGDVVLVGFFFFFWGTVASLPEELVVCLLNYVAWTQVQDMDIT